MGIGLHPCASDLMGGLGVSLGNYGGETPVPPVFFMRGGVLRGFLFLGLFFAIRLFRSMAFLSVLIAAAAWGFALIDQAVVLGVLFVVEDCAGFAA